MLSADLSPKKCENIFPCSPSLSLVVYNFSENTSRKYPFMVCFGWIHAYVGTDLVCVSVRMCMFVCGGFAAAEQNQDYRVNGQYDCRLLYVSGSVTAVTYPGRNDYQTWRQTCRVFTVINPPICSLIINVILLFLFFFCSDVVIHYLCAILANKCYRFMWHISLLGT